MNKNETAMFIGHRLCSPLNYENAHREVLKAILTGTKVFVSGADGTFERFASIVVNDLKKKFPWVQNHLILPDADFKDYDATLYDKIIFPQELKIIPHCFRITARNKYIVNSASLAICYLDHTYGDSGETYKYALEKGLEIVNLGRLK